MIATFEGRVRVGVPDKIVEFVRWSFGDRAKPSPIPFATEFEWDDGVETGGPSALLESSRGAVDLEVVDAFGAGDRAVAVFELTEEMTALRSREVWVVTLSKGELRRVASCRQHVMAEPPRRPRRARIPSEVAPTDAASTYLVSYGAEPVAALGRDVLSLLAPAGDRLPRVVGPFSAEESAAVAARIEGWERKFVRASFVELQPAADSIARLPYEEAERLALECAEREFTQPDETSGPAGAWPRRKGDGRVDWRWIGAFELPRCWIFLLYDGPNIPPGLAVIIDHHSGTVMPEIYFHVANDLEAAGFDVVPQRGKTIVHSGDRRESEQRRSR